MGKNIIFVFSGTGNSLWAAKEIGRELEACEIVSMGSNVISALPKGYERIGFVYPTYAGGMPRRVKEFVSSLELRNNKEAYFFTVASCGRIAKAPNVIAQMHHALKRKGLQLSYGERLDMFSNYVVGYEMRDTVREEADRSALDIKPMLASIKNRRTNHIKTIQTFRRLESMGFMCIVSHMDKNFHVSDDCIHCDICKKICPVKNISMEAGEKPSFTHHCEQCLACIQNCPVKAINYKDKTQNRKRYMHPDVSWKELAALNESTR